MAKKKSKQDRKYQMPRMVCKGCGKDCKSSILLHLKRLSCRSEYTEEEYNDLKLKAKEVSDLNKKYDPNIKERAKKLRKARYERTKEFKRERRQQDNELYPKNNSLLCGYSLNSPWKHNI